MTIERAIFEREITMIGTARTKWVYIEPAPPKDWRPICYDSQYNKLNGCDPGHIIVPTCQQCPWLAARHKTEVNRKIKDKVKE